MTHPKLTRLKVTLFGSHSQNVTYGFDEDPNGEYVRFADVEAYTQAAIAVAMMEAVKPLEWVDGQAKGLGDIIYGIDIERLNPQNERVVWEAWYGYSHEHEYSGDPIDIGTAYTKEGAIALADASHAKSVSQYLSIPTDAMAALDAMMAEAEQRGFDRCKEQAAQIVGSWLAGNIRRDIEDEIRDMKGGA